MNKIIAKAEAQRLENKRIYKEIVMKNLCDQMHGIETQIYDTVVVNESRRASIWLHDGKWYQMSRLNSMRLSVADRRECLRELGPQVLDLFDHPPTHLRLDDLCDYRIQVAWK